MSTTSSKSVGALKRAGAADSTRAQPAAPVPHRPDPHDLPDEPLVQIEPGKPWSVRELRDLWLYRELLYFLVWRDIKVRYKQTALGIAWVVMQPVLTALIFSVFLGALARVPTDADHLPYPLFVFAGLLPWTFFSGAVANSGNSLVGSAHLITKVYFPRVLIPVAAVGARLVDFLISFAVMGGLLAFYRVWPGWHLLMLPAMVALVGLLALGVGLWASAANVRYRDVGVALPVLIQLWMFASPVVYPLRLVPEAWRGVYSMNPLVGVITGFRSALLGLEFDWPALGISAAVTLVVLAFAAHTFRRTEKHFADIV